MTRGSGVFTSLSCLALALWLGGCPEEPEPNDANTCGQFVECGACANQPQCGWCVSDGEGLCIGNTSETNPEVAPDSCGEGREWFFMTADSQIPEGTPGFCPAVAAPDETSADEGAGGEEPAQETFPVDEGTEDEGGES